MKKLIIAGICLTGVMACKKEYDSIYSFTNKENTAKVKVIHTLTNALYSPKGTATAPLQVYMNGQKITGNNITFGAGVFPNLEFAQVSSGNVEIRALIPKTDTTAETEAMKKTITLESGQTYSLFITDTIPDATVLAVKEDLSPVVDSGKFMIRFVNVTAKSLGYNFWTTSDKDTLKLFDTIPYLGVSKWAKLNVGTGARGFAIRKIATPTVNFILPSFTPTAGRMYTIFSYGVEGTTGFRAPKATSYTTRFQTYQY